MIELSLQKGRADLGASKAPDPAKDYEREITTPEVERLLQISMMQQRLRQPEKASEVNYEPHSRRQNSPQPAQGVAATEKQQVENGTNTGWVTKMRGERAHRGDSTISNTARAIDASKSDRKFRDRLHNERKQHSRGDYGLLGHRKPRESWTAYTKSSRPAHGFNFELPA